MGARASECSRPTLRQYVSGRGRDNLQTDASQMRSMFWSSQPITAIDASYRKLAHYSLVVACAPALVRSYAYIPQQYYRPQRMLHGLRTVILNQTERCFESIPSMPSTVNTYDVHHRCVKFLYMLNWLFLQCGDDVVASLLSAFDIMRYAIPVPRWLCCTNDDCKQTLLLGWHRSVGRWRQVDESAVCYLVLWSTYGPRKWRQYCLV